jgi:hypothetical protein
MIIQISLSIGFLEVKCVHDERHKKEVRSQNRLGILPRKPSTLSKGDIGSPFMTNPYGSLWRFSQNGQTSRGRMDEFCLKFLGLVRFLLALFSF